MLSSVTGSLSHFLRLSYFISFTLPACGGAVASLTLSHHHRHIPTCFLFGVPAGSFGLGASRDPKLEGFNLPKR